MLFELIIYLFSFLFACFGMKSYADANLSLPNTKRKVLHYSIEDIQNLVDSRSERYPLTFMSNIYKTDPKEVDDKRGKANKNKLALAKLDPRKYTIQITKAISYRVFGRRYHTLSSSENYRVKGIASWYGPRFHKRKTSSGERYNMFNLTAAHKTLPLLTYVQVTNLVNGRRVIVKVNDRGPFVGNRVIDLSYAAAKKIGMVTLGIAPVSIKALG